MPRPPIRLYGKQPCPPASARKKRAVRKKCASSRQLAVSDGCLPSARRPFALFVQDNAVSTTGMGRDAWKAEMKKLGLQWRSLSAKAQESYKERSRQEFAEQRAAMRNLGIPLRVQAPRLQEPKRSAQSQRSPQSQRFQQSNEPQPGKSIGNYTVASNSNNGQLGEGSYGSVFLCYNKLQKLCAVKVFKKHAEDLEHEAFILTTLQKKLSESIRCFFPCMFEKEAAGCPFPFFSMEYFGASASSLLRQKQSSFDLEDCMIMSVQLQAALQALHRLHILHLDVKTSNILWCCNQRCLKLADFGMAEFRFPPEVQGISTLRYAEYVTTNYRAPELWGLRTPNELAISLKPAVDLWSYGCVIYEVACAQILMRPLHSRARSPNQTLQCWCQNWLVICKKNFTTQSNSIDLNRLKARMMVLNTILQPIVLAALHPNPAQRKWSNAF